MSQKHEALHEIYKAQKNFYNSGETQSIEFRINQLKKLKEMLKTHETTFSKALREDLGKHPLEAYSTEIGMLYHSIDYMMKHLPKLMKKKRTKTPLFLFPANSFTLAESLGNTLIMSAFNYPMLLAIDPLIGAIAGGNTAIVSLSENSPATNNVLMDVVSEYFPTNYLYFFESSIAKNTDILKMKFDKIFFTGSPKVGKIVYEAASKHLTPVTLELGGKSPAIVTCHAKLPHAAKRIAWGKFLNAGQTCVAPDYCLVDRQISEEFIGQMKLSITEMYGEIPRDSADYGRIIGEQATRKLEEMLTHDKEFVVIGGEVIVSENYVAPTVLCVKEFSQLATMKEEIFGPILPIIIYDTLEEALEIIQSFEQPLAFYPFTENKIEQRKLLNNVSYGGATMNDTILHLANLQLPFGGVGNSGIGHYHGKYSFEAFTHQKSVLNRKSWLSLPVMNAPYTKRKEQIIRKLLK